MQSEIRPSGTGTERPAPAGSDSHPRDAPSLPPVTVGVEEEYLLVDPVSRELSTEAGAVVKEAAAELGDRITTELTAYQIEVRTRPHQTLAGLADDVRSLRASVTRAAARLGLRIISSGSPVLGQQMPPPITSGPRYARSVSTFRALDDEQSVCACHVHVGVSDLTAALDISNHLRLWLPTLTALSANSPFWQARDTGYASWRTVTWWRWPIAGPPPFFESRSHFEDLVDSLITTGSIMDRGGLYWDIRPSHHVPTVEVRVADAASTVNDTVLLAGAVKGLALRALQAISEGRPAPRPQQEMLRAASWRAARDGLAGKAVGLTAGHLVPAISQVRRLLAEVEGALPLNEASYVRAQGSRLITGGNGADRQRAAYARRSSLNDVVDCLISATEHADG